jgi:L,D-peptidoglycan transpeptidase YkuD (ErfK/YbiS/YcfS/YnhG family)
MLLKVYGALGSPVGRAEIGDFNTQVVLGRNGVIATAAKREGDGCTPLGTFKVLYGFYRPDRIKTPTEQNFKWLPLTPALGWCDDPTDPAYNALVPAGYAASHEALWREDTAYDRLLVISHNLPAIAGFGSAVFIHLLHPGKAATAGCVALSVADFDEIVRRGVSEIEILLV